MKLISCKDEFQLKLTKNVRYLNNFQIIIFLQNSIIKQKKKLPLLLRGEKCKVKMHFLEWVNVPLLSPPATSSLKKKKKYFLFGSSIYNSIGRLIVNNWAITFLLFCIIKSIFFFGIKW